MVPADGGGEQLVFDAMPAPLFACTPTRLATFGCPRRYRLTYLDRPTPPRGAPWAHNTVGAAVHVALARWWDQPVARRTPDAGASLVVRAWQHDGFRDDDQSSTWRMRAAGWVRDYLDRALTAGADRSRPPSPGDPGGDPADATPPLAADPPPLGVERTVATTTEVLALSGRIDRLDDRDGVLVVVDYKTGRHVPTSADAAASPALALYALAAGRTLRRRCATVELHHLPTGTVAAATHTAASMAAPVAAGDATARRIEQAAAARAAGARPDTAYPTVPGPGCSWCDVRRHCPDGQRASTPRRSWEGLAVTDDGESVDDDTDLDAATELDTHPDPDPGPHADPGGVAS